MINVHKKLMLIRTENANSATKDANFVLLLIIPIVLNAAQHTLSFGLMIN